MEVIHKGSFNATKSKMDYYRFICYNYLNKINVLKHKAQHVLSLEQSSSLRKTKQNLTKKPQRLHQQI